MNVMRRSIVVDPKYEDLYRVLMDAYQQAAVGKGSQRHANDRPFKDQPMQSIIALNGKGFATGQISKKVQESLRMEPEHAIHELLGAIVYAAGLIVYIQNNELDTETDDDGV